MQNVKKDYQGSAAHTAMVSVRRGQRMKLAIYIMLFIIGYSIGSIIQYFKNKKKVLSDNKVSVQSCNIKGNNNIVAQRDINET